MRKLLIAFTSILLIVVSISFMSCSGDEEAAGCKVGSQTYSIERTWAYSTHDIQINVSGGCIPAKRELLVDGAPTDHAVYVSSINFTAPSVDAENDSIVITLRSGSTTLFEKKIALFPGNGTWTEVTAFSGEARQGGLVIPYNSTIYYLGGYRNGASNTLTYYGDFYALNTGTNQWSLVGSNDLLKGITLNAAVDGDVLYGNNEKTGKIVSLNTGNTVEEITDKSAYARWASLEGVMYQIRTPEKGKFSIEKFSATNKNWELVKEKIHGYGTEPDYILIVPAFSYQDKIYFMTYTSAHYDFWSFRPDGNILELVSAVNLKYFTANNGLHFLFARNGLLYFIDRGGVGTDMSGNLTASGKPGDYIVIYNLEANEWIESANVLPEQFRSLISYTANNKLYAGLSTNVTPGLPLATGVSYSSKIYEFKPE
ncbi:MAG TPA: hypothetical protein VGK59_22505 [Ohtaekwangia sp.]